MQQGQTPQHLRLRRQRHDLRGDGNDVIYGGVGNDFIEGGVGKDRLSGDAGNDLVLGGDGSDRLFANAGTDTLNGGLGLDYCYRGTVAGTTTLIACNVFPAGMWFLSPMVLIGSISNGAIP